MWCGRRSGAEEPTSPHLLLINEHLFWFCLVWWTCCSKRGNEQNTGTAAFVSILSSSISDQRKHGWTHFRYECCHFLGRSSCCDDLMSCMSEIKKNKQTPSLCNHVLVVAFHLQTDWMVDSASTAAETVKDPWNQVQLKLNSSDIHHLPARQTRSSAGDPGVLFRLSYRSMMPTAPHHLQKVEMKSPTPSNQNPATPWLHLEILSVKVLNRIGDEDQPWTQPWTQGWSSYHLF